MKKIILVLFASIAFPFVMRAACPSGVCVATDASQPAVQAQLTNAVDGDTVIIPASTGIGWTQGVTFTKYITIQGSTTVTGAGTQTASANDQTNIIHNFTGPVFSFNGLSPTGGGSNVARLTGVTITEGTGGESNVQGLIHIEANDHSSPLTRVRVDHCHLVNFKGGGLATSGWSYGVADHNFLESSAGASQNVYCSDANYANGLVGNGSWADFPFYGSDKFFFFEDSTFKIPDGKATTSGALDAESGARYVIRHNYFINCRPGWHGTEGNRGMRVNEIYNNTLQWSQAPSSLNRSGTTLYHDNTWLGTKPQNPTHSKIQIYRVIGGVGTNGGNIATTFGMADGANVLDTNDTEGDGTFVEGHTPHLYQSGTATGGSTTTLIDTSKSWTPSQWIGFSVSQANTAAPSYPRCGFITGNTATSITFESYPTTDRGPILTFAAGDAYTVHKLLRAMDQGGAGKSDLMSGGGSNNNALVINTATNSYSYAHSSIEPMMSWNNVYTPDGTALGFGTDEPNEVANRDYYNLGKGLTTNGAPSAVTSIYTAALNGGVAYSGPYTYPHPLAGGVSTPAITSNSTATFNVGTTPVCTGATLSNCAKVTTANFSATPTISIGSWSPAVSNVTFTDNGDGTATMSGNANGTSAGTHTATITAHHSGDTDATQSFSLIVVTPNNPPTASLSVSSPPVGQATFTSSDNVTITALASDSDGTISTIDILDTFGFTPTVPIKTCTNATKCVLTTTLGSGTHGFTAKATDNAGAATTSSPVVSLTVSPGGVLPPPPPANVVVVPL